MMTTAWNNILNLLERNLKPSLYSVWIKPLTGEVDGRKVTISAPNDFVANWVRDRLHQAIHDAAVEVVGADPVIKVTVSATKPKKVEKPAQTVRKAAPAAPQQLGLPIVHVPDTLPASKWRFSFDDFIVGPSNELACAASRTLCSNGLNTDNLFLSSAPGLGKTHLLQSIGAELTRKANRIPRIANISSENFVNRLILAIKGRQVDSFKRMFRENVDVLLLEDIHFFKGKEKMQDELLGTLKALRERGCKVVMTSTFMPRDLSGLDSSLVSRLSSGFLAHIDRPDFETRRRIVESKARKMLVNVPVDVSELLAERITTDIRQLESCLNNLVFKAKLLNRTVSTEMAWEVLENYAIANASPDMGRILEFVARYYGIDDTQLRSRSRKQQIVLARNTAFYLARKHTDMSLKAIGEKLNRRHSTVLKGIAKVEQEISSNTPAGRQLKDAVDRLGA